MRCRKPPKCHHNVLDGVPHPCHFGECPPCTVPCGQVHARCGHACQTPCHYPTSCKPCDVVVERECVGKHETRSMACSAPALFRCSQPCNRLLSCGRHRCTKPCHAGDCGECNERCTQHRPSWCTHPCGIGACHPSDTPCPPCDKIVKHKCHCTALLLRFKCQEWGVATAQEKETMLSCGSSCKEKLPCGHSCEATCHSGPCPPCSNKVMVSCPCGAQQAEWSCERWIANQPKQEKKKKNKVLLSCVAACTAPAGRTATAPNSSAMPSKQVDTATAKPSGAAVASHQTFLRLITMISILLAVIAVVLALWYTL